MTPVFAALVALACTIGGALAGMLLRARLPEHHFDADSKDVVKLVMGLIATISALVLGLLIASAQSAFSQQGSDLQKVAADLIQLDRLLGMYGAETRESRDLLRQGVIAIHRQTWTEGGIRTEKLEASVHSTGFFQVLQKLAPVTDTQRFIQAQVFQLSADIDKMKLLMFARPRVDRVAVPGGAGAVDFDAVPRVRPVRAAAHDDRGRVSGRSALGVGRDLLDPGAQPAV
jgi:hypothetical protein